tara:strand:- start:152 stop:850 length:699 start_codon:yes stop_codon:yes gene_type:complete
MADLAEIQAEPRAVATKGATREMRRSGRVPGILYGGGEDAVAISVEGAALHLEHGKSGFFSRLYSLILGKKNYRVLAREVQVHPKTDALLHIDFLRLTADSVVNVDVPVVFQNEEESPGLKRGGVLNVVRRTIELACRSDAIPSLVEADVGELDIGDSVKISAISLPEGATPVISDRDFTIATVAAPTVMVEEVEEEEVELGEDGEPLDGETPAVEGEEADASTDTEESEPN